MSAGDTTTLAGDLMADRLGSVDPSRYPDEEFDLYSIPAFDAGASDLVFGKDIGSAKQVVQPGDVLLSKIVPHIRRTWVVGKNRGRRIIASGEWIVFRSDRIEAKYLRHVLVGDPFHAHFMATISGVGGSLMRARPSYVAKIEIPTPSLAEQRRIADILDRADALRAKRRAALARLDELTQAIFVERFGIDHGTDWPEVQLKDVTEIISGFAFKSDEYVTSGEAVRLCRGTNVLPGRIDWSDLAQWPASKTAGLSSFELRVSDVVIAMDRPWISEGFKIAMISPCDCPSFLVQRVARIRADRNLATMSFVHELLRQPTFTNHCKPTETTVPHISPVEIRRYSFRLPPLKLQTDFDARVETIRKLKQSHQTALSHLNALFASLQDRAFRGAL